MPKAKTETDTLADEHKAEVSEALAGVVAAMENARLDGFVVEFSLGNDPSTGNVMVLSLGLMKRW